MRPKVWLRAIIASLMVAAPVVLWTTAAEATIDISPLANFTSPTVPGQTAPAVYTIVNNSDGPEAAPGATVTVTRTTLIPSCGSAIQGCPTPDPNVYQLNGPFAVAPSSPTATCPPSYSVTLINPATGELLFTPNGPNPVLFAGEFCRINFTTTTLRVPTTDLFPTPANPGVQTAVIGSYEAIASTGALGVGSNASIATVNRAPATIATTARGANPTTPQQVDVGEGFTDTAIVTGAAGAPTPTGTVTFQLYGPTSPGFPTCAGAPFATSPAIPLTATGPTTATAATSTFGLAPNQVPPGNYVFVATYSGDTTFLGSTSLCSDAAERITVNALPTITVDKTATPLTRAEPGGSFTFNVVVTNNSAETVTITSLTDDIYGNIAIQGSCTTAVGTVLAPSGGTYACSFTGSFTGMAPAAQTDVVTAVAQDSDGNQARDTDDATVSLTPALPTIVVDKTATPLSRPEPGGAFTFNVVVTNTSVRPVTITTLTDNIYGNIATQGSCVTAVGTVLGAVNTPSASYNCSFSGNFFGNAGAAQTDIVTSTAIDSFGNSASDTDDAVVTITNVLPTILVDKTANPLTRPEPGGAFTFNVVVTNTSIEPVTITSLTDNIYGNIAIQGTCTTALGTVLPVGGTYSCAFSGTFFGSADDAQTDIVTAVAVDDDGSSATDTDDATVTLTDVAPTVLVDKTATPASRPEPGGAFTFNVVVTNTSIEPVTITSLVDDIYGNLATQGTCTTAIGTVLVPGATYSCAFTSSFTGNADDTQTDVVDVIVIDDDGTTATDEDDATVVLTDVLPTIQVDKTASPVTRLEPGGAFTFNVVVTNTSPEPVTITTLTDNIYGNIAIQGTCTTAIGTVLAPAASYSCAFSGNFFGGAGAQQVDIVTATAVDDDGSTATDTDDATVAITDLVPSILVDKTVTPDSLPEPGGTFTFRVVVTNVSIEPVTITSLTDDIYGNLATQGTCTTAIGTVLAASGGTYTCSFPGNFSGDAGDAQTDIVTAIAVDDEGSPATDSDDAVVTITNVIPTIRVDKTATPLTRPEPGGTFTFNVVVTNTSGENLVLTSLSDDVYGNLATQGTCTTAIGTSLVPGGTYSCAFSGPFTGDAGDMQTDVVTVTGVDNEGTSVNDDDDAVVTLTDVAPTVLVDKTAVPLSLPEPGGSFTFNVVVTNTSAETVSITTLTDDVYGNLATQGTCTTAIGTVLAPGASYSCSFVGAFAGNAGDAQTDIVSTTVTDNDGSTATDSDDATVTITDVPPTVLVVKSVVGADSRPEPGGSFTFRAVVTNTSAEPVTITALTDDVYGNLAGLGSCTTAIGTVLAPGASYTCEFTGSFSGTGDAAQTDIVTVVVTDDDGTTATDDDDATVTLTDVVPIIQVDKTALPLTRPEPGGDFTFNVVVTNTNPEPVTITGLTDDVYGNIATMGTCTTAIGTVLAPSGGSFTCSFTGTFTGQAGDEQTDIVTATVADDDGNTATDTDDAIVSLLDVEPSVVIDKTVTPETRPEPGGEFTFQVVVTNTSIEPVTITSLDDDVYGDLSELGSCTTAIGTELDPDESYTCSFTVELTGNADDSETDTVTVVVVDDDGTTATDEDDAVVTLTDVPPIVEVVKTATPESRPAPGGAFTFNVVVKNTSAEPVTITTLTDDIYGNIATQGTCTSAIGTVLAPAATYSCSFSGNFAGASGSQKDIVTVVVTDDDGTSATDTDDATVTITPNGALLNQNLNNQPQATTPRATTTLPRTGSSLTDLVTVAVGLLVLGGLALVGASRWAPAGSGALVAEGALGLRARRRTS